MYRHISLTLYLKAFSFQFINNLNLNISIYCKHVFLLFFRYNNNNMDFQLFFLGIQIFSPNYLIKTLYEFSHFRTKSHLSWIFQQISLLQFLIMNQLVFVYVLNHFFRTSFLKRSDVFIILCYVFSSVSISIQ